MTENDVRDDIAFIRRAVEDGRAYASTRSPDMVVWGVAVAFGYLATYAYVRRWQPIDPNWIWLACIALPWAYSLRRTFRRLFGSAPNHPTLHPLRRALLTLWLGFGIAMTVFSLTVCFVGENRAGWIDVVDAGILGIGFFVTAPLCNLPWLRYVAYGWWLAELGAFALRHQLEILPFMATMMLLLLALPGAILLRSAPASAGK
jgi:hypothetical protein